MRTVGIVIGVPGVILAAIGFIWGWVVGFYPRELPYVIGLVVVGGLLAWLGFKLMDKGEEKEDAGPQRAMAIAASTPAPTPAAAPRPNSYLAAVAPTAVVPPVVDGPATVSPSTTATELAELAAARPELWSQIEVHPQAYPDLIAWIADARAAQLPPVEHAASDPAAAKVADPATTARELADLAKSHPELRAAIARHPAAYPALKEWIAAR